MKYSSSTFGMIAASALLSLSLPGGGAFAQLQYRLTELGTLGGTQSVAYGINDSGQVAGWAHVGGDLAHAFLWTPGGTNGVASNPQMKDLATLGGLTSKAYGINNSGYVVGQSSTAQGDRAFVYDGLTMSSLGTLGGTWSYAYDINDAGKIAGSSGVTATSNSDTQGFVFTPGGIDGVASNPQMKAIPLVNSGGGKHFAEAHGINNSGTIVGFGDKSSTSDHAFKYVGGVTTDISPVGADYHYAWDINANGWIAGEGNNATNSLYQAYRYDGVSYLFLGTLGGTSSEAYAINDNGDVVGRSRTADTSRHAFVYTAGQMRDLNNLIAPGLGWTLNEARGINSSGQIVGFGLDSLGRNRAFLLTRLPQGDTDYDSDVDLSDLGNLASHYGTSLGATWGMGDFDGDGDVDLNDLGSLSTNYGAGAAQAFADFQSVMSIPEPHLLGLLAVSATLTATRARRRVR